MLKVKSADLHGELMTAVPALMFKFNESEKMFIFAH